jgi:ankyrin repeat protein
MSSRRDGVPSSGEGVDARALLLPSLASLGVGTGMDAANYSADDEVAEYVAFRDERGRSFLHVGCRAGDVDLVRRMLEYGADVGARDSGGQTPLHVACQNGHVDSARLMLAAGADPNARDLQGLTPLHLACMSDHDDCARVLLRGGADVNARELWDVTPLHLACVHTHLRCARLLLEYGADVDAAEERGVTPLHDTCTFASDECTGLLLSVGARTDVRTGPLADGETPLHPACRASAVDCARRLLAAGADVHADSGAGVTPLSIARSSRRPGMRLLWEVHQLGEQVAGDGRSPFDWTEGRHALFSEHLAACALDVEGALRALLLAEARRAGCAPSWDAAERVLRTVAR